MHYVTRRSRQMQKYKSSVTCLGTLFGETAPSPPEYEKYCVNVLHPRRIRRHYVTRISHRLQKHNFGVTYPGVIFVESVSVPPEHENFLKEQISNMRSIISFMT
jgi:hypothetical protein